MRRVGKRREVENKRYRILKHKFFLDNPVCHAQLPGCLWFAFDVHHKAGREGKLLNMVEHWMPVCRNCHEWITANGKEAKVRGWKYEIKTN